MVSAHVTDAARLLQERRDAGHADLLPPSPAAAELVAWWCTTTGAAAGAA